MKHYIVTLENIDKKTHYVVRSVNSKKKAEEKVLNYHMAVFTSKVETKIKH